MISITIPVISGFLLDKVFDSIAIQNYNDYEIICVNDSNTPSVSNQIQKHSACEVISNGSLLSARLEAALHAKGDYVLQLDETRYLTQVDALSTLNKHKEQFVFIREREHITNLLTRAADIDKQMSFSRSNILSNKPYVLPRYYKREVLIDSLKKVKENLGDLFSRITAPEDLLTYREALTTTNTVGIEEEPLIAHFGDTTIRGLVRKYSRYGKHLALISDSQYSNISEISIIERMEGRLRNVDRISDLLLLCGLWCLRSSALSVGLSREKLKLRKSDTLSK